MSNQLKHFLNSCNLKIPFNLNMENIQEDQIGQCSSPVDGATKDSNANEAENGSYESGVRNASEAISAGTYRQIIKYKINKIQLTRYELCLPISMCCGQLLVHYYWNKRVKMSSSGRGSSVWPTQEREREPSQATRETNPELDKKEIENMSAPSRPSSWFPPGWGGDTRHTTSHPLHKE